MKKLSSIHFLIAVLILGIYSCNKLEYTPEQSLDDKIAINNLQTAQAALIGLYGSLQGVIEPGDYSYDIIGLASLFSDEGTYVGTFPTRQEFNNFQITTANLNNTRLYQNYYAIATQGVNTFIEKVKNAEDPSFTEGTKEHLIAEASVLRAYAYFYLVNYYGRVPLITEAITPDNLSDINYRPNTPVEQILKFIEDELDAAIENFNDGMAQGGSSYLNIWSIKGFTARVKLYLKNYEDAFALATEVIEQSPYRLDMVYDNIFGVTGKSSSENLWYIDYSTANANSLAFWFFPRPEGRFDMSVRDPEDLFAPEDAIRKATTLSGQYVMKYRDVATGTDPIPLLRMSEIYLIGSEAAAEIGEFGTATDYLNAVRNRVELGDVELDVTNYLDLILAERKSELCFEPGGHRLLDLRRTGRAVQVLGQYGYTSPKCDLWPIPSREREANPNLDQNPQY